MVCVSLQQPPTIFKRLLEIAKDLFQLPRGGRLSGREESASSGSADPDGELKALELVLESFNVLSELRVLLVYNPPKSASRVNSSDQMG